MERLRIGRNILAAKVPPEEQGVPSLYQAPQPRVPMSGREIPMISGCETSGDYD